MLNLPSSSFISANLPFCVGSVGSPKLLVPISSRNVIDSLCSNFEGIKEWNNKNSANGIYAYTTDTLEPTSHFYARSFNPNSGSNEDAAIGVAAAALASIYADSVHQYGDIIVEQGHSMGTDSSLIMSVKENGLSIGGHTIINGPIDVKKISLFNFNVGEMNELSKKQKYIK